MKSGQKIWAGPSPSLIWTKSKRTAAFFRDAFPYEEETEEWRRSLLESAQDLPFLHKLYFPSFYLASSCSLYRVVVSTVKYIILQFTSCHFVNPFLVKISCYLS